MLLAINNSLPDGLAVNKLDVAVRNVRRLVSQKGNPDKKVNISVPARTLALSLLSDVDDNGDAAIQQFQKKLLGTDLCIRKLILNNSLFFFFLFQPRELKLIIFYTYIRCCNVIPTICKSFICIKWGYNYLVCIKLFKYRHSILKI